MIDIKRIAAVKDKNAAFIALMIASTSEDSMNKLRGLTAWDPAVNSSNLPAVYSCYLSLHGPEAMANRTDRLHMRITTNERITNAKQTASETIAAFKTRYTDLRQESVLMGNPAVEPAAEAASFIMSLDYVRHGDMIRTLQNDNRMPQTIDRAYEIASVVGTNFPRAVTVMPGRVIGNRPREI